MDAYYVDSLDLECLVIGLWFYGYGGKATKIYALISLEILDTICICDW